VACWTALPPNYGTLSTKIVALVRDFLAGLDEKQQNRFLNLVAQGPRPLVAKAMGLADAEALLDEIQVLRDAIADDVYVEYGAGYDPEYGTHRGFGDDSWIGEMDDLFATYSRFSALKDELRKAIEGPGRPAR
jgi:hypothetical protein